MILGVRFDSSQVDRSLARLPGVVGVEVRGKGLLAAAQVVVDQAKATAPFKDRTGRLRRSIRARPIKGRVASSRGGVRSVAKAGSRAQAGSRGSRQAHLIERGHGGPKPAPAYPFMGPAYSSTVGAQLAAGVAVMRKEFERAVRSLQTLRGDRAVFRAANRRL